MQDEGKQSPERGKFEIDSYFNCLFYDGAPIPLSATDFRVFRMLYDASPAYVHNDQILQMVWGNGGPISRDPNSVEQALTRLRKMFRAYGNVLDLHNKRNGGHRLVWPGKDTDREQFILVRPRRDPFHDALSSRPIGTMRRALKLSETDFTLKDDAGKQLWTYHFPHPLRLLDGEGWRFRFLSPEANEKSNLLVTARFNDSNTPDSLLFVCPPGKLKWSLDAHANLFDYDGSPFSQAWTFTHSSTSRTAPGEIIWAALVHETKWPGCVLKINAHGQPAIQFVNTGYVEWLHPITVDGEECLIVCGYNNAYEAPFVAIIGKDDPPSCSPNGTRLQYRYADGPSGNVRQYILLPMMQGASGQDAPFSCAKRITHHGDIITVSVALNVEGTELRYCFTPKLDPLYVYPSEDYYRSSGFEIAPRLAPRGPITSPFLISWTPHTDWQTYEIDWRNNPMR